MPAGGETPAVGDTPASGDTPAVGDTLASGETPASGETAPVGGPAAGPPGRDRRADGVREAITSRGAGWAVAAAMAGAVVGRSGALAAGTGLVRPGGAAGLRGGP